MKISLVATLLCMTAGLGSCSNSTSLSSNDIADATKSPAAGNTVAPPQEEATTSPSLDIPAGFVGVWVEDPADADAAGADYEAALIICESGSALYAVYSNQLYVALRVARRATPAGDIFSFYYDGIDVGRGFANASFQTPDSGALVGTGRVEGEGAGVLAMDWKAGDAWVKSIRDAAPNDVGRKIFPANFYHNMVAMAGLCEETE